jgi:hypothetical protein
VRRLAGVIADEMELRAAFGVTPSAVSRGYEGPNTDLA